MSNSDELDELQLAQLAFERSPFGEIPIDQPWDLQVQQPEWMLDKLIPARSIGMIYGPSNSGKSHLLCDIIVAQVMGESHWQGIPIEPGPVVLFTESIGHMKARLRAYIAEHGGEPKYPLWVLPSMTLETRDIRFLIMWLDMLPDKVVHLAFDTVATSFSFEENDNREASALLRRLEDVLGALKDKGCITLVHHTSKASEGRSARGASALIGNIDWSINVQWDKQTQQTIAGWEKDRWRLVDRSPQWAGRMRKVDVEFVNGSASMGILEWEDWSDEMQQVMRDLERESRVAVIKTKVDEMIAIAGERPTIANAGCKLPPGANAMTWPKEWSSDVEMIREYIRDEFDVEPVFNRAGREVGFAVLGREKPSNRFTK